MLTPTQIVYHDHSHCTLQFQAAQASLSVKSESSYLIPLVASDLLNVHVPTTDASTLTIPTFRTSPPFCIELFADNNEAIQFYTGFESYQIVKFFFDFLGDAANHLQYRGSNSKCTSHLETRGAPRVLTPINEFFLVLCRLRCALLINDLAFRFGISQSTVSRIFTTWINFLYFKLKDINLWPSRMDVNKYMPQPFKDFFPTTSNSY